MPKKPYIDPAKWTGKRRTHGRKKHDYSGDWVDPGSLRDLQRRLVSEWLRDPFEDIRILARRAGYKRELEQALPPRIRAVIQQETVMQARAYEHRMGLERADEDEPLEVEVMEAEKEATLAAMGDIPQTLMGRRDVLAMLQKTMRRVNFLMDNVREKPNSWMKLASAQLSLMDRMMKATGADKPEKDSDVLMVFAGPARDETLEDWCEAYGFDYEPPPEDDEDEDE